MNTVFCAHSLVLAMAATGLSVSVLGQGVEGWPVVHEEAFGAGAAERWRFTDAAAWAVRDGRLEVATRGEAQNTFATLRGARLRSELVVEVGLTVRLRTAKEGWSFAGIALYQDGSSFWMLGLTEAPDGRRYTDLLESYNGTWQAQSEGETALPKAADRVDSPWSPEARYRLRLVLERGRVSAEVLDAAGKAVAGGAYSLPEGAAAVRAGLPALVARGCRADFETAIVRAPAVAAAPALPVAIEEGPRGRVGILLDALPGGDRAAAEALAARLRRQGFGVTALSVAQVCDDRILTPSTIGAYIIPVSRSYPVAGGEALVQYARQGGHIVFVGGPLLDLPLWQAGGEWLSAAQVDERCGQVAIGSRPFSIGPGLDLSGWQRATDNPGGAGSWQVVPEGPDGGSCLRYTSADYRNWDGRLSPPMTVFGEGHDLFLFRLKADAQTPQISVELQEEDGSRWIATVEATTEWRRVALRPESFQYWPDSRSSGRGGAGDHLTPAQARRINFGLAHTHTPAVHGPAHEFQVADIGTARNPLATMTQTKAALGASLESVWPRYKTYPLADAVRLEAATAWQGLPSQAPEASDAALLCAIPRTQGRGFDRAQKWRYVPLLRAVDGQGRDRGAPAWLLLNRDLPYPASVFLGFGLNDGERLRRDAAWGDWVAAALDRVLNGLLLAEAGTEHFAYWPGEAVVCGARLCNPGRQAGKGTVTAAIRPAAGGAAVWERQAVLEVAAGAEAAWQETWTPPAQPAVYRVEVTLADAQGQGIADRIVHEVAVLDPEPAASEEFIRVRDGGFVLRGKPWYPIGVNYWPLYISGLDAGDYWAGWLDQRFYEPELVERDLARMEALGITMVSIQYQDVRFHRNVLDFLRRCQPHGIKVNLFMGLASPIAYQEEALRTYLETARLAGNATLFAYDTIWEPGNYLFGRDRTRWDGRWRDWIAERYGSLAVAEAEWGVKLPRDGAGLPLSPPEAWFRDDGDWRVAMAAYRRFMDDLTSALWNRASRGLRRLDPNHLISFRQGNTLPHDFALSGPVKHIDFICPEGYSIPNTDEGGWAAGFISRYVDFTTRGKPILWSEFGTSVWDPNRMEPSASALPVQAQYHERFYRMVLESGAQGTAPWWWPGGYRVEERSDYGIMNLDGTPRPAAELIRGYGPRLHAPRARLVPDVWFEFDRDAHAGGYWYAAFNPGKTAYRDAVAGGQVLGVRSPGTDTTSITAPALAVGNRPLTGANPAKYLNAEFNWLQVQNADGAWVEAEDGVTITVKPGVPVVARVCVGNTQEATWVSGAEARDGVVVLATTAASQGKGRWALPADVPYLGDADLGPIELAAGVTVPVDLELQMLAVDRAGFGEKRTFRLAPAAGVR